MQFFRAQLFTSEFSSRVPVSQYLSNMKRRHFLVFLGAAAGTSLTGLPNCAPRTITSSNAAAFKPIKSPMPYGAVNISTDQQPLEYAQYAIQDDIVLPEAFTYDVIASWGDPVGDSRFGYNNDYLSFIATGPHEGYLTVNFEYISTATWEQTYAQITGKSLPFQEVVAALGKLEAKELNAFKLPDDNPLKAQIRQISEETLIDQGLGVIAVRREADGRWIRVPGDRDRRVSGISGLKDGRYLKSTGPATAVFRKTQVKGYTDGLDTQIIGTFGNCAGGTTPWGTALSAEENIQNQVPEAVHSDGSSFEPGRKAFNAGFDGQGNVFGLAGNKYGWIVEIDPSNPDDYGTKHTWLGRYRHEAVGVRAVAGKPLAFYSGCDRRGGHVYKFISSGRVIDPTNKENSRLMKNGMLYAAKFRGDGTGSWIPLTLTTPVDPVLPSEVIGGMVTLPKRPEGGFKKVERDAIARQFKKRFATLGDLYEGNNTEKQGAILIDAHFAANAAGATATARPEDTEVDQDGTLFIAFTSGMSGQDGGPDKSVFVGPNGEEDYEEGWVMKVVENDGEPGALTFTWRMFATGGEPAEGGLGFANPDNLAFDQRGNLWLVTDMSTGTHNKATPHRVSDDGEPLTGKQLPGMYGNNSLWQIPLEGDQAGEARMFAYGPMECELTGPFFTDDGTTLFIAAQHPGERGGIRADMASDTREFAMQTTNGKAFTQQRDVPIGSNWPDKTENAPPKPSVVAIRRIESGTAIV